MPTPFQCKSRLYHQTANSDPLLRLDLSFWVGSFVNTLWYPSIVTSTRDAWITTCRGLFKSPDNVTLNTQDKDDEVVRQSVVPDAKSPRSLSAGNCMHPQHEKHFDTLFVPQSHERRWELLPNLSEKTHAHRWPQLVERREGADRPNGQLLVQNAFLERTEGDRKGERGLWKRSRRNMGGVGQHYFRNGEWIRNWILLFLGVWKRMRKTNFSNHHLEVLKFSGRGPSFAVSGGSILRTLLLTCFSPPFGTSQKCASCFSLCFRGLFFVFLQIATRSTTTHPQNKSPSGFTEELFHVGFEKDRLRCERVGCRIRSARRTTSAVFVKGESSDGTQSASSKSGLSLRRAPGTPDVFQFYQTLNRCVFDLQQHSF